MDFTQAINSYRIPLAQLPTPIEEIDYPWSGHKLFVKRDDLTGSVLSGNKIRKLEYLLADAKAKGCDTVITCGGVQSNHARATAIAARQVGLDSVLVLTGERPDQLDGNLLLGRMVGANIRIIPPMSSADRLARAVEIGQELEKDGRTPYVIPSGGSNELGVFGYMRAAKEIEEDCGLSCPDAATVVVPVGSGGTYAGLFLGLKMLGSHLKVVGATVDETPEYWHSALNDYMDRTIRQWDFDITFDPSEIQLIPAAGLGYAISEPAEIEFISDFAKKTSLVLDPVYTGKAMYALDREINSGKCQFPGDVIFVHTGGVFGLFAQKGMVTEAVGI